MPGGQRHHDQGGGPGVLAGQICQRLGREDALSTANTIMSPVLAAANSPAAATAVGRNVSISVEPLAVPGLLLRLSVVANSCRLN